MNTLNCILLVVVLVLVLLWSYNKEKFQDQIQSPPIFKIDWSTSIKTGDPIVCKEAANDGWCDGGKELEQMQKYCPTQCNELPGGESRICRSKSCISQPVWEQEFRWMQMLVKKSMYHIGTGQKWGYFGEIVKIKNKYYIKLTNDEWSYFNEYNDAGYHAIKLVFWLSSAIHQGGASKGTAILTIECPDVFFKSNDGSRYYELCDEDRNKIGTFIGNFVSRDGICSDCVKRIYINSIRDKRFKDYWSNTNRESQYKHHTGQLNMSKLPIKILIDEDDDDDNKPLGLIMSGFNEGCYNELNGYWHYEGKTKDGKNYYWRWSAHGKKYLYFDPTVCGMAQNLYNLGNKNRWFIDSNKPSTTADNDLDGNGACKITAYLDGEFNAPTPPISAIWKVNCGGRWEKHILTLKPATEAAIADLAAEQHVPIPSTTPLPTTTHSGRREALEKCKYYAEKGRCGMAKGDTKYFKKYMNERCTDACKDKDKSTSCPVWTNKGKCVSNPSVKKNCPESCQREEETKYCGYYAEKGRCGMAKFKKDMNERCPKECKDKDKSTSCPVWANKGKCVSNPSVKKNCPESCS